MGSRASYWALTVLVSLIRVHFYDSFPHYNSIVGSHAILTAKINKPNMVLYLNHQLNYIRVFIFKDRFFKPRICQTYHSPSSARIANLLILQSSDYQEYFPLPWLQCMHRRFRPPLPMDRKMCWRQKLVQFLFFLDYDFRNFNPLLCRHYCFSIAAKTKQSKWEYHSPRMIIKFN